jgi:hypothetical protein
VSDRIRWAVPNDPASFRPTIVPGPLTIWNRLVGVEWTVACAAICRDPGLPQRRFDGALERLRGTCNDAGVALYGTRVSWRVDADDMLHVQLTGNVRIPTVGPI